MTFRVLGINQKLLATPSSSSLQRTCLESLLLWIVLHILSFVVSITSRLNVKFAISWDSADRYLSSKPIHEEEDGRVTTTTKTKLNVVPGASSIRPRRMHLFLPKYTLRCVVATLVVGGGVYASIVGSHRG